MSTFTKFITETFHVVSCYTCGSNFGINGELYNRAVENKEGSVYCPACAKGTCWTGKTEADKLRDQLASEKRKLEYQRAKTETARAETEHERHRVSGYKGVIAKTKKRIANGVCPCCNRSFTNLADHMHTKHPTYVAEAKEK